MGIDFDINALLTPYYIVDERLIRKNLAVLKHVKDKTGCKILLAQKAFSMFSLYPLISEYLDGTTASGLFEAKLGFEEMGGETHIFSPGYPEREMEEILDICDHVVFNSINQWNRFKAMAMEKGRICGLRINPECSTQEHAIYDPCAPGSRLGIRCCDMPPVGELAGITGLHFHTLCEQNTDALQATLCAVEEKFGAYLYGMEWLNFGGGHHITRPDYDVDTLISEIKRIQETYGVQVYLEPGEAVALDTGYLVAKVEDIVPGDRDIAVLNTSAACHMPDVLEMPYRPEIIDAGKPGEKRYTYRLGGSTCLAGDIIGDYSFDLPLSVGSRVVFCDMAHYSMVKNNTFNGMKLPSIAVLHDDRSISMIREFGYEDFKNRLS